MPLIDSVTIPLPNASAAAATQARLLGQGNLGQYNLLTNSCVTHCMDVARSGGLEVPGMRDFATMLGRTWPWFRE
jgi:hypothetical protein